MEDSMAQLLLGYKKGDKSDRPVLLDEKQQGRSFLYRFDSAVELIDSGDFLLVDRHDQCSLFETCP